MAFEFNMVGKFAPINSAQAASFPQRNIFQQSCPLGPTSVMLACSSLDRNRTDPTPQPRTLKKSQQKILLPRRDSFVLQRRKPLLFKGKEYLFE